MDIGRTVRDATLSLLREAEMTTIFGNPGSTELPFFRNFPADFRYVLGLQESIVLGMADGYAQATRRAALVNLHSAAGVGHGLGNLFTAFKNQTPLVITAGQQARSILPYEPFLFAERATEFPRPYVKWATEPARAEDVPASIARAFYIAMEPPCGPTFVSIPIDDWDKECEPITLRSVVTGNPGHPEAIAGVAGRLAAAKNPVLVVAAGVGRDDAWSETVALAECHEMPVWVAPLSARCGFPEDHRLFAGFLPAFRQAIVGALSGHDLILALGGPLSLYHAEGVGPHLPDGTDLIAIGDNVAHATWAPVGDAIVADVKLALKQLLAFPAPLPVAVKTVNTVKPVLLGTRFDAAYLFQQINRLRPDDSIIVEEAPSSRDAMHDYLPILRPDSFFTCASGGLGHGLPAAIGVSLGQPTRKTIAVLGDGSSMYAIQGLWTATQFDLPVSFVIVNNRRYEALEGFGRLLGLKQPVGTKLGNIDFCELAHAQGLRSRRVTEWQHLDEALSWSFASRGPTLVEVVVD
jgi:benzoylformate decarboxylase